MKLKIILLQRLRKKELMSKYIRIRKYIGSLDYFDKSLIVLSATSGSISNASFVTVIGAPVGIASASFTLAFSTCKALIHKEISHENFMTITNEEKIYRELKESIRMMHSQRSDTKNLM